MLAADLTLPKLSPINVTPSLGGIFLSPCPFSPPAFSFPLAPLTPHGCKRLAYFLAITDYLTGLLLKVVGKVLLSNGPLQP